ncbi:MAG: amidohydrolase [Anaerolineales bacterium]|nr:amidohydrolase [Anaerolineales bacterium]
MNTITSRVEDIFPFTRSLRREFHRHPELGFQEFHTAEIILRELKKMDGFLIQPGMAETGILAFLEGGKPGKTILLRFDMDALPVYENTGVDYASENAGLMHACGHDGHMAIGLTVARLLAEDQKNLTGQIKIVFQPAEEGLGGAQKMIKAGVLENPRPDIVLGMHLWNEKPLGWLGISDGPVMSASETFRVVIKGKGGHGGKPHEAVDPIVASAAVINALQTLVAREVHPLDSAVITVASIHGGKTHNVIPGDVTLEGTIRTFTAETRKLILQRFRKIVEGTAEAHLCSAAVEIEEISPAVENHPEIAEALRKTAQALFPEVDLVTNYRTMASEDMAFFLQDIPGCYSFIGSANPEAGLDAKHHQPEFNFDEKALITGAALLIGGVVSLLKA